LAVSASEGSARDYLAERPGFIMDALVGAMLCTEKRVLILLRRLLRRFLVLYPQAHPSHRLQHVRFYPWLASSIVLRLGTYLGFSMEKVAELAKTGAESVDVNHEVRSFTKEEGYVMRYIAEGKIPSASATPSSPATQVFPNKTEISPQGSALSVPVSTTPQVTGSIAAVSASTTSTASGGGGSSAQFPPLNPGHLELYNTIASLVWKGWTAERARSHLLADEEDDKCAKRAWANVKNVSEAGEGVAYGRENHVLSLLRITRDVLKFAPTFMQALILQNQLFQHLTHYISGCEEIINKQARNEPLLGMARDDGRLDTELRSTRAAMLSTLIPLLCTRQTFHSGWRKDFMATVGQLVSITSDPGLLRTCFGILETWILGATSPSPGPIDKGATNFGITQKECLSLLENSMQFLALPTITTSSHFHDINARNAKLPSSSTLIHLSLQSDYYRLILRIFTGGRNEVGMTLASAVAFVKDMNFRGTGISRKFSSQPPHARLPSSFWFMHLQRYIHTGLFVGDEDVRVRCGNLALALSREKCIKELEDEYARLREVKAALRNSFRAQAEKRRGVAFATPGTVMGGVQPLLSYPPANPFTGSRLPFSYQDRKQVGVSANVTSAGGSTSATTFNFLWNGDQDDPWHTGLDGDTATALESAYSMAIGAGPTLGAADYRPRLLGYTGLCSQPLDAGALSAGPLQSIQDILSMDWDCVAGYAWLPQLAKRLIGAVESLAVEKQPLAYDSVLTPSSRRAESLAYSPLDVFCAAQDNTLGLSSSTTTSSRSSVSSKFLTSLSASCTFSLDLSLLLWTTLFPQAWRSLAPSVQSRLTPHLSSLLFHPNHNFVHGSASSGAGSSSMHLQQTPISCVERSLGVLILDSTWDIVSPDVSWNPFSGPLGVGEAVLGSSGAFLGMSGSVDNFSGGAMAVNVGVHDPATASPIQQLFAALSKCDPPIPFPSDVLSLASRISASFIGTGLGGVGLSDLVIPLQEQGLEKLLEDLSLSEKELGRARNELIASRRAAVSAYPTPLQPPIESVENAARAFKTDPLLLGCTEEESEDVLCDGVFREAIAPGIMKNALASVHLPLSKKYQQSTMGPAQAVSAFVAARSAHAAKRFSVTESVSALCASYAGVGADDLKRGLLQRFASTQATSSLLDLEMQGQWTEVASLLTDTFAASKDLCEKQTREKQESTNQLLREVQALIAFNKGEDVNTALALPQAFPSPNAPTGNPASPTVSEKPRIESAVSPDLLLVGGTGQGSAANAIAAAAAAVPSEPPNVSTGLIGVAMEEDGEDDKGKTINGGEAAVSVSTTAAGIATDSQRNGVATQVPTATATPDSSSSLVSSMALPQNPLVITPSSSSLVSLMRKFYATSQETKKDTTLRGKRPAAELSKIQFPGLYSTLTDARPTNSVLSLLDSDLAKSASSTLAVVSGRGKSGAGGSSKKMKAAVDSATVAAPATPALSSSFSRNGDISSVLSALRKSCSVDESTGGGTKKEVISRRLSLLSAVSSFSPSQALNHLIDDSEAALAYMDAPNSGPFVTPPYDPTGPAPLFPSLLASTSPRYNFPPAAEVDLWESSWVEALRQLGQWGALKEYSRVTGDAVLGAEVYSRLGEWVQLGEVLQSSIPSVALETGKSPFSRLLMVEVGLQNPGGVPQSPNSISDPGVVLDDVTTMWLRSWQSIPQLNTGAQYALLSSAQRIREMHESISICTGLEKAVRTQTPLPDIKHIICSWRDRHPNKWEGLLHWDSVLLWREHVFKHITRTLSSVTADEQVGASSSSSSSSSSSAAAQQTHEINWTLLKLSHVARKLGLKNFAAGTLGRVTNLSTPSSIQGEVEDAFSRAKELLSLYLPDKATMSAAQAKVRRTLFNIELSGWESNSKSEHRSRDAAARMITEMDMESPTTTTTTNNNNNNNNHCSSISTLPLLPETETPMILRGLSIAHALELDSLALPQRSKILAIKAGFCQALGPSKWPHAYESYACAINHHPGNEKAWLSWGSFLERLYNSLRVEGELPDQVLAAAAIHPSAPPQETTTPQSPLPEAAPSTMDLVGIATGDESHREGGDGVTSPLPSPSSASLDSTQPLSLSELVSLNPIIQTAHLVAKFVGARGSSTTSGGEAPPPVGAASESSAPGSASLPLPPPKALASLVASQAIASYLQAMSLKCVLAPLQLARVFGLLASVEARDTHLPAMSSSQAAAAGGVEGTSTNQPHHHPMSPSLSAFFTGMGALPCWVWLSWIPQLLSGLVRSANPTEGEPYKLALRALCVTYPQALYFPLRSMLQEMKREHPMFSTLNDTFTYLRRCHPQAYDMDAMVDDIYSRFSHSSHHSGLEEELLAQVIANLHKAQAAANSLSINFAETLANIPAGSDKNARIAKATEEFEGAGREAAKTLLSSMVKRAYARLSPSPPPPVSSGSIVAGAGVGGALLPPCTARSILRYRHAFLTDFSPTLPSTSGSGVDEVAAALGGGENGLGEAPNPVAPVSLQDTIARLQSWRSTLIASMAHRRMQTVGEVSGMGETFPMGLLSEVGPGCDIEIPGQYASASPCVEPHPTRHVRIVSIAPRLQCFLHSGGSQLLRRIVFLGDDGRRYAFLLHSSSVTVGGVHSHMGQCSSFLSGIISRHHSVRQRSLAFPSFVSIPFSMRLKIIPDLPGAVSFSDLIDYWLEKARPPCPVFTVSAQLPVGFVSSTDDLLTVFRDRLLLAARERACGFQGGGGGEAGLGALQAAYSQICSILPPTALKSVIKSFSPSAESLAALHRRFCSTTAMQSLYAHLFTIHDRSPAKLSVVLSSGSLISMDPRPLYRDTQAAGSNCLSNLTGELAEPTEAVPFRLSRNMVSFITPQGLCGPVSAAMISACRGMGVHTELITSYLTVLFKEEFLTLQSRQAQAATAAASAGSAGPTIAPPSPNPNVLYLRATGNALKVVDRFSELQHIPSPFFTPRPSNSSSSLIVSSSPSGITRTKVFTLLSQATSDENNSRMPPSWHPWF